jgi:hypothetical protein
VTDYVNQLEDQIADNRELVAKRDIAIKLAGNREFNKLIIEGFLKEDCARYAQLSADPSMSAESRADSLGLAQAAGHLKRYLSVTVQMGNRAEAEILKLEEAIQEARIEDAEAALEAAGNQPEGVVGPEA